MNHPNPKIMEQAIALARSTYKEGGHAVSAIIVQNEEIVTEAFTTIIRDKDPTAHAEINAIRQATKKLNERFLNDSYMYTTYEPCPMCTAACVWARMKGIVYGASRDDQTSENSWRVYVPAKYILSHSEPVLELYPEFMRKECKTLLSLRANT
jgi:tRNA(adenine34) deaminase